MTASAIHPHGETAAHVCVLIPAFNAAETLGAVVARVCEQGCHALVIDDGSRDATREIAERAGARVVGHAVNQGKGKALQTGFAEALRAGHELVITLDADGQHEPEAIPQFLWEASAHPEAALIIGNRMANIRRMPWVRRWTNRWMSGGLSQVTGLYVPDSQCGYRLVRAAFLRQCRLASDHFEIESELILEAGRLGHAVRSIPIHTVYAGEESHIHPARDTLRFFRMLFRYYQRHPEFRPQPPPVRS